MIKNERQLRMTKSQLENFKHHLDLIENVKEKGDVSLLIEAEAEAVRNQIKELEDQIFNYESLWASNTPIPILQSFKDIPQALIKARISLGLSQKEFAEKVGLKEQQIQRYEATSYETASLSRINQFVNILNLELSDETKNTFRDVTYNNFLSKLRKVGIDRDFILTRLIPPRIKAIIQNGQDNLIIDNFGIQVVEHISKIFGWASSEILGDEPLDMNAASLGNVRFKVRRGFNVPRLTAYTFYTHYLSDIIMQATRHLPIKTLPTNPYEIHKTIIDTYESFTLEHALRYVWSLGVPVIFLNDPGAFHGAHFRDRGRSIIILNQRTKLPALWLFSLFHEFWHATQHQENDEQKILEIEDFENLSATGNRSDKEEREASLFAGAVLLGRSSDKLVRMCVDEAQGDLLKMRQAVLRVARRENVPVDVLANCVAFRLSRIGENWWGPAQNLQEPRLDIQLIARDILLDNIDLSQISGLDLDLLRRSLIITEDK